MNAANEEAVRAFIAERIQLTDIPVVIGTVMDRHQNREANTLDAVLIADREARDAAVSAISEVAHRPVEKTAA
jgi:1-deoxy-D-xylulose-5-phosphate reductoisomerase